MSIRNTKRCLLTLCTALALSGCDRNVEPYVADEEPEQPDLAKIFPQGPDDAQPKSPMPPRMPPAPGMPGPARDAVVSADAPPIRGIIRVDAALQDRVPQNAVLFIIARQGAGGPPLAVEKISAPRFPLEFSLGPENRMVASIPFAGPFQITVRLDGDGNAASRNPGDLQGAAAGSVSPGATGVEIVLDQVL
ncbi:MAG: hypothetical protein OEM49_03250 [Myxococcales bacterium]|nr:hypothetical protein [Myxococcales bacterium]MDH5306242.1 hypothetical protein [Myxococcales bacterium]MDH5565358.1 hypothetical protein [Myxococcales bacterium]